MANWPLRHGTRGPETRLAAAGMSWLAHRRQKSVVVGPWVQGVVATFLVRGERCDGWTVCGAAAGAGGVLGGGPGWAGYQGGWVGGGCVARDGAAVVRPGWWGDRQ